MYYDKKEELRLRRKQLWILQEKNEERSRKYSTLKPTHQILEDSKTSSKEIPLPQLSQIQKNEHFADEFEGKDQPHKILPDKSQDKSGVLELEIKQLKEEIKYKKVFQKMLSTENSRFTRQIYDLKKLKRDITNKECHCVKLLSRAHCLTACFTHYYKMYQQ